MGKKTSDGYLDGGINAIIGSVTMNTLSAEPANYAAIAGLSLGNHTLTGGDFTKANGDSSGRKATVAQQADVPNDFSGTATHVCIDDGVDFYVTTCASQALTAGGTHTIPAWDIEFADPS